MPISKLVRKGSREIFEALLEHIPEGLIIVSAPDLTVTAISELGSSLFGRPRSAIEGQPMQALVRRYRFLTPNGHAVTLDDLPIVRASRNGETIRNEQWVMADEQDHCITISMDAAPVRSADGAIVGAITSWSDISALKTLEGDLRKALDDGSIMLGEAHHRFRNHLQMLSTLLTAEAQLEGSTASGLATMIGNRLSALASAQAAFQGVENDTFNAASLLGSVCQVFDSGSHPVKCVSDPLIEVKKEQVTPLALAVNEGVMNALKHAFPEGRPGTITVSLRRTDGRLSLEVADDGAGISNQPRPESLGLRIMGTLARQLNGDFCLANRPEGGSVMRISFPA